MNVSVTAALQENSVATMYTHLDLFLFSPFSIYDITKMQPQHRWPRGGFQNNHFSVQPQIQIPTKANKRRMKRNWRDEYKGKTEVERQVIRNKKQWFRIHKKAKEKLVTKKPRLYSDYFSYKWISLRSCAQMLAGFHGPRAYTQYGLY